MALCFQEEKNIIKSMEQLMVDQLNHRPVPRGGSKGFGRTPYFKLEILLLLLKIFSTVICVLAFFTRLPWLLYTS